MYANQKHADRQLLRDELDLLRRLGSARRSASTRLPILRRTGATRPIPSARRDGNAGSKAGNKAGNKERPGVGRALVGSAR